MPDTKIVPKTDSIEGEIESVIYSYYDLTLEIRKRTLALVDHIQDTQLFN